MQFPVLISHKQYFPLSKILPPAVKTMQSEKKNQNILHHVEVALYILYFHYPVTVTRT